MTISTSSDSRRIVFVVGSGRSGTSMFSGILQQLGLNVPQPEVAADHTNPKGFGEPQWVVDYHSRLLKRACVGISDARPQAWSATGKFAAQESHQQAVAAWLDGQLGQADELVIKDPRLSWFMRLWRDAAMRSQAEACFATMLRTPTEVVGSKYAYYRQNASGTNKEYADGIAAWVNVMLHTERATRGAKRIFVGYHDLLDDWTKPVFRAADQLELHALKNAAPDDIKAVNNFIDPSLRRIQLTWDEVQVPRRLRELASDTWEQLNTMSEPDGDNVKVQQALDELLDEYVRFYGDAEAIANSSIIAARKQERRKKAPRPPQVSSSRRLANRIPHRVRAAIPARIRTFVRRAAKSVRKRVT